MATGKIIEMGNETQNNVIAGVKKAADAIKVTLGPAGKCVAISNEFGSPEITRDGATVAKTIQFKDQEMNIGAQLVKKAASLTEEACGDGTSSSSLLTKELCLRGQKFLISGCNVNEIKSGMLKATDWVKFYIKKNSIEIGDDLEKIRRVATISANNDPQVGDLVVECMSKVGVDGVITADMASGLDTVIDVTTGMKLSRGWSSPQYITSPEDGKCIMENPYIVVVGEKLSSVSQILPLIEQIVKTGRPFLIICDEVDEVVNTTLIVNTLQGAIRCCVVKGIDFGDARENIMQDIAVATGGTFICQKNNIAINEATLENLGAAKKVVISRDDTIIYEGLGNPEAISKRVEVLKARLNDPTTTHYDKTKFSERIANLSGGIGLIKAGGATETEKVNRKATIEDAILASKSALSEGCAPGGGYVYLMASKEVEKDKAFWKSLEGDEVEGAKIVFSSLPVITKTVAENSGMSGDVVLNTILGNTRKTAYGYNAKAKNYCNLLEAGILDSSKVLRVALENAVSTASMVLLIDCTISDEPEEKKA